MKKIVALFILFQIIFLSSCSSNQKQASSNAVVSSGAAVSANSEANPESFSINQSQLENLGKPKQEIKITVDELIKAIDKSLQENKYKLLSDQMPTVEDYKDPSMGDVNENQYDLGDGILLSIYSDKENDKITGVQFFISKLNATTESLKYYVVCVDATIRYLDSDNATAIEKTLDLSNIENNEYKSADTDKYHFFYSVQNGTNVLMIELNKE